MPNPRNPYKKQSFGVDPQVFQTPLMGTGFYSALARDPGYTPAPLLQGQGEYSRAKWANMLAEPNKEIKNLDLNTQSNTATALITDQPFWDSKLSAPNGGYIIIQPTGTVCKQGTLCQISQGTGANQREGRQALVTGIVVRARVQAIASVDPATANTGIYPVVRLMLLLDRQCNGAPPLMADLLEDPTDGVNAHLNLNNAQRFVVLQDQTFPMNGEGLDFTNAAPFYVEKTITMVHKCNIPLQFASTDGTVNELRANNIVLVAWSTQSQLHPTDPFTPGGLVNIECTSRILFMG